MKNGFLGCFAHSIATGVNLFHYVLPGRNTVGKAKDSCDIWYSTALLDVLVQNDIH